MVEQRQVQSLLSIDLFYAKKKINLLIITYSSLTIFITSWYVRGYIVPNVAASISWY